MVILHSFVCVIGGTKHMPLRLNSLMERGTSEAFTWIVQNALQSIDDAFMQSSQTFFLGSTGLIDSKTGTAIGKYVFTFFQNIKEKRNELLDLDIVLNNSFSTRLELNRKLAESSDSNEYYEAVVAGGDQHLTVETVNRYTVEEEVEGTTRELFLSAFPFELSVYKNEKEFNKEMGFEKPINVANTGFMVHGLGTSFISPGYLFCKDEKEPPFSFVVGTISDYKKVVIAFGKIISEAYVVTLHTALGELPTLVGTEMFDTKRIKTGRIVGMNAFIKANFVKDRYPERKAIKT